MPREDAIIQPARLPEDLPAIAALFRAYQTSLGIDLCFQNFEQELADLPGQYAPPSGALLIARSASGPPIGCAALRPLNQEVCEMKRLYIDPSARGSGLGRALAEGILAEAKRIGYTEICLDTLPSMSAAIELYRQLGFRETTPYYRTPIKGTLFLSREL